MLIKNHKIKILLTLLIFGILLLCIAITIIILHITPPKDKTNETFLPSKYFCETSGNYIDYQTDGKCASFASAYVLRHLGKRVTGCDVALKMKRIFGFTSPYSIVSLMKKSGYNALAYHGTINTLKAQLINGCPIIVFIRIPRDTHYAVVVGYDEHNIYLVDSMKENANTKDARYNRIMKTKDFQDVWKTNTILPNNIYIVINN